MSQIQFVVDNDDLCLCFEDKKNQQSMLARFAELGIELVRHSEGTRCFLKPYTPRSDWGFFVSAEGRLGLLFPSEKLKFMFKESVGLKSDCFMDMGPGYDTQLHFNADKLRFINGATLTTVIE